MIGCYNPISLPRKEYGVSQKMVLTRQDISRATDTPLLTEEGEESPDVVTQDDAADDAADNEGVVEEEGQDEGGVAGDKTEDQADRRGKRRSNKMATKKQKGAIK